MDPRLFSFTIIFPLVAQGLQGKFSFIHLIEYATRGFKKVVLVYNSVEDCYTQYYYI